MYPAFLPLDIESANVFYIIDKSSDLHGEFSKTTVESVKSSVCSPCYECTTTHKYIITISRPCAATPSFLVHLRASFAWQLTKLIVCVSSPRICRRFLHQYDEFSPKRLGRDRKIVRVLSGILTWGNTYNQIRANAAIQSFLFTSSSLMRANFACQ